MTTRLPIDGLRGLHQDLVSLVEHQLQHIDTLRIELEGHIESFRGLLDRPTKSDASRKELLVKGHFKPERYLLSLMTAIDFV